MSDASDIFEKLLIMMAMGEFSKAIELPVIEVDEAEINKAEKMYVKEKENK